MCYQRFAFFEHLHLHLLFEHYIYFLNICRHQYRGTQLASITTLLHAPEPPEAEEPHEAASSQDSQCSSDDEGGQNAHTREADQKRLKANMLPSFYMPLPDARLSK